jgi:hypothetical protein
MFLTTGDFDAQMQLAIVAETKDSEPARRVEVKWEDEWYKAKTIGQEDDKIWICYVEDASEELVEANRIRPYKPEGFPVGARVSVASEAEWYPATVKKFWYGLHFISYDDYPESWDEWVSRDRIHLFVH